MSSITSADASATSAPGSSITPAPSGSAASSAASASSSSGPQTHTVKAGLGGFNFNPDTLENVAVGDTVAFEFYPPDHSVARADFMSPCVPYEYTAPGRTGFWSDTQLVSNVNDLSTWRLKINSTEPIFYYCAAPGSCIDKGMIGVINPNSTQTLEAQKKAADSASYQVKPGEDIPSEASSTLPGAPHSSSTASSTPTEAPHSSHALGGGAIAGIVVGAVAFLVICAALFFYVGRTKSLKEMMHRRDATVSKSSPPEAGQYNHPASPGYAPSAPYSPTPQHAEYGGQLPSYGQHNATDQYPSGWTSPSMHPAHTSMTPHSPQPQMAEAKYNPHESMHELASPTPGQQSFTAELEAPIKAPR